MRTNDTRSFEISARVICEISIYHGESTHIQTRRFFQIIGLSKRTRERLSSRLPRFGGRKRRDFSKKVDFAPLHPKLTLYRKLISVGNNMAVMSCIGRGIRDLQQIDRE